MTHCGENYSALWKPVHDSRRPRGQQHSLAKLRYSVHCDSPLALWVMKGLINESIRVSVFCSLCVSGMQSGPDVPSLRAHRGKGCHCWQAWWMGGMPRIDKDECDSPHLSKGGWCTATKGRSCDADHLLFLASSHTVWDHSGERTRGEINVKRKCMYWTTAFIHLRLCFCNETVHVDTKQVVWWRANWTINIFIYVIYSMQTMFYAEVHLLMKALKNIYITHKQTKMNSSIRLLRPELML